MNAKATKITEQIKSLEAKRDSANPGQRAKIQARITKLRTERDALLG